MKRIAFYLSLVLVVLVLASCKKGQKNLFTPTSSGRPMGPSCRTCIV